MELLRTNELFKPSCQKVLMFLLNMAGFPKILNLFCLKRASGKSLPKFEG